jgi:glucosamine--fructose-6-phosphate aminotransferase (isomerizing)
MCGIVGYVGPREATPIIFNGLKNLEYRGYDSAGIAVIQDGQIEIRRDQGKLVNLEQRLKERPMTGHIGMGHTRWATHGRPSRRNAHPHLDCTGQTVVIQNGIVENYRELRRELRDKGHEFASETDTEVIVHLVEGFLQNGATLEAALQRTLERIKGAHAIVVLSARDPGKLVAARLGNAGGVVVGLGQGEMFVASDIPAILEHTQDVIHLADRQIATVTASDVRVMDVDGFPVENETYHIPWDPVSAVKGNYRHFMQKEIYEQAMSVTHTIADRVDFETGKVRLDELNLPVQQAQELVNLAIVACGTSVYAGRVGQFMLEKMARVPVGVDYASEYRYRDPLIDERTTVLAITQSGETVDTLAAMEEARDKGTRLWSIVNVIGSQADRMSDGRIYMRAGPEIGVASTKAFTASLVDLYLLGLYLGQARGTITPKEQADLLRALQHLPRLVGEVLDNGHEYDELANLFHRYEDFLYLGRGINYPIALEGALKLKEISYVHAEGYPAGEMKHGPIALIDENMPVMAIAVQDHVYDKMISQIEQVKARGGVVIAVATEGDEFIQKKADHVIYIPQTSPLLTPVLTVLPLQLFAYHVAVRRGADVDQPRNLAKSVTVE